MPRPKLLLTEEEKRARKRKYDRLRYIKMTENKPPKPPTDKPRYKNRPTKYNTRATREECGVKIIKNVHLHLEGNAINQIDEKDVKNKTRKYKPITGQELEYLKDKLDKVIK